MNLMPEILEKLGLEIDERFDVESDGGICTCKPSWKVSAHLLQEVKRSWIRLLF